jgi:hypothetical protein
MKFYSGVQIEKNRMSWACSRCGGEKRCIRGLVGKPEGKRPLGKPRRKWEVNITIHCSECGVGGKDWIDLAQDRDRWRALVNAVMKLWVS